MSTSFDYDIIIVWASFAWLATAYSLDPSCKVLVIDQQHYDHKKTETTWLITQDTKDLFDTFLDTAPHITNAITHIWVVDTSFQNNFFSETKDPWIYSTDTPALISEFSNTVDTLDNCTVQWSTKVTSIEHHTWIVSIHCTQWWVEKTYTSRYVVGWDGSHSLVARECGLSTHSNYLIWKEYVYYGDITLWEQPKSSVYHFWFGEFSLGYGWRLSPTTRNGKAAFRLWLAKNKKDARETKLLDQFVQRLIDEKIISINWWVSDYEESYIWIIPIGWVLKDLSNDHAVLVWDAAWFCWAFAADGIKWALLSWIESAKCIQNYLQWDTKAFKTYLPMMNSHNRLMRYYKKQVFYRRLRDQMKSNRTFDQLFKIIKNEKETFLYQFCDSKDRHKSLPSIVLKWRNLRDLVVYGWYVLVDMVWR